MIQNHELVLGHELIDLYNKNNNDRIKEKMGNYNFDEELAKINDAFREWRYCYEYDQLCINSRFLYDLCKTLEEESRITILSKCNLDMNKSFF